MKKLVASYAIEKPEELLLSTLTALLKTVRSANTAEALLSAAEESADRAFAADNFELAGRYARLAMGLATSCADQVAVAELKSKVNEIEQCKKEYAKLAESLARLKSDPDDAETNLSVGRFYAFTKGDFERGLPS